MKVKINELNGAPLDWAVAKCEGIELESGYGVQETSGYYNRLLVDGRMSKGQSMLVRYIPSTDWAQGGPIIELEGINLRALSGALWEAETWSAAGGQYLLDGPTPLVAAMRCYVASKLGNEIELPDELGEK